LWTTPANPPGAPVTGYRVQRLIGETGEFETVHSTTDTHWVDKRESADGDILTYRVVAINSVGHDEANHAQVKMMLSGTGDTQMLVPLPEHPHTPVSTVLTGPEITDVTVGSDNRITVTWADGANADSHSAILFSSGSTDPPYEILEETTSGSSPHTFDVDVEAGMSYAVVIHSISGSSYMYDLEWETIPAN
jgi:hypothetical protein